MDWQNKLKRRAEKFEEFIYGVTDTSDWGWQQKWHNYIVERTRINEKVKSMFYRLFAVLVNAGVTTIRALNIIKARTTNERFYRIIATIEYDVSRGESLSRSMEKFPDVFSKTEVGIIQTGEAVGAMENAFNRLAGQLERSGKLQQDLQGALIYPAIVGVVLILAGVVMITFVIPELRGLYEDNGLQMNGLTSVFINSSEFFANFWIVIFALVAAAWFAFKIYIGDQEGKLKWDAFILDFPYLGGIVRKYNLGQFTGTLGVLIESGIPIHEALRITNKSITNSLYSLKTYELIGRIQTGDKISEVLAETPWLFPPNVTQMIEIGEQSATLGGLCDKIAVQYDEELSYQLKNINTVIGPIVIIIVAVFVVLFALAILLPIFNLTQSVGI